MAESLPARKPNVTRPKLPRPRDVSDLIEGRSDIAAVDASYGETLRELMPRRLGAIARARPRA